MKKIIIVAPISDSLINFRGDLIQDIKNKGCKVITVSPTPSEEYLNIFKKKKISNISINFKRNKMNPLNDFILLVKLFKIFKKQSPDVVLSYAIKPVIWSGLAAKFCKTDFYALITGLGFAFQGTSFKRKLLTRLVVILYRVALKKSKAVIFQNKDNLNLFVEKGIVPRSKTHLVNGSGVDIEKFNIEVFPKGSVNFLCISRLLTEKGLREYAAAAKIVKKKFPSVVFNLVGAEDTSLDAIPLDEVNKWSEYIDYKGSTMDVRSYIKDAHVYVLPSYHEGIPRSTLEAMSMGRAIITTDATGCKETVENGINGFKVPVGSIDDLAEKMIWFIEHPEQIELMGIESRRMVVEKFDVHKVNEKMLDIMNLQ
jgi:glycosyltransferase involved in cell wall biosynthesis